MVELKLKICIYKVVKEISRLIVPLPPTPALLAPPHTHAQDCLSPFGTVKQKSWLNRKMQLSHFLISFSLLHLLKLIFNILPIQNIPYGPRG